MKKVISLVMALVMMMAICVPAFAATLDATTQSNTATVQTDTSAITGDGTYSVTYPATMNIVWDKTEATNFIYTVNSQLKTGKLVNVKITDEDNEFQMVNTANAAIPYTLSGATDGTTTNPVAADAEFTYSITVEESAWKAVSIDSYSDTLTFTVSIVDA